MDWYSAINGGDDAALELTQSPVPRPTPVPRPGSEMSRQAPRRPTLSIPQAAPETPPAASAQPPEAATDWYGAINGTPTASPAVDPNAEPDAKTWLGRRMQDIRGKQDPRTKDLGSFMGPTMERELPDAAQRGPIAGHILLGQDDDSLAKLIGQQLGPRFRGMRKDANGYPIVSYIGQDGQPAEAYVNKPGLDMQDLARGVASAVPYVAVGGAMNAAAKGMSLVPRMLAQGTGQGVTAIGTDVAAAASGVADPDPSHTLVKAGLAAGFGAGGEAVGAATGALWRKFVTEPGLYDKAAGQLTPKGAQAAQQAGLDPTQLSRDLQQQFAQDLARTGSGQVASRGVVSAEFGIPRTRGELQNDIPTLIREQQVRGGNYGPDAANRMKDFDTGQQDAVRNALFGEITTNTGRQKPGIAQTIAPNRSANDYGKAEVGGNIRANTQAALDAAQATEDAAWKLVPRNVTPDDAAIPLLRQKLNEAVRSFPIDEGTAAGKMANDLQSFLERKAPGKAADWIDHDPVGNVEEFRKRLSARLADAVTPTEKKAAGAMYGAYNDWVREAAEQGILKGANPVDVAQMVTARGISRSIHEVFDGQKGTPGARILADVLKKADSAEGVVNALFTGPTSEIKAGTIQALRSLKQAYDKHLAPDAAKTAWDDIRLAYVLRMVQDTTKSVGDPVGAQALQSNINRALSKQMSVARELLTPDEIGMLRRFSVSLQGIEKKNINRSWSGVSAASFAKDFFNALITAVGFKSTLAGTVGNMAGANVAKRAYGSAAASQALSGVPKALSSPSFAGYGGAYGSQQD
jgi:hypothetical protein